MDEVELWELRGRDGRKRSSCAGPDSQLDHIKDKLLLYVFELRETSMVINYLLVLFKVASLSASFRAKSYEAQFKAVERFTKKMGYGCPKHFPRGISFQTEGVVSVVEWKPENEKM